MPVIALSLMLSFACCLFYVLGRIDDTAKRIEVLMSHLHMVVLQRNGPCQHTTGLYTRSKISMIPHDLSTKSYVSSFSDVGGEVCKD